MSTRMPLRNGLILLTAAAIWGTAFVAQSVGMDYMGPFTFNGLRYFLGALVLVPVLAVKKKIRSAQKETDAGSPSVSRILKGGVFCGFFLCVASNLQQFAIISVDVGKAGFLTAMYIVIVPVLTFLVTRRTSLQLWISVALACAGLYFLSISGGMRLEQGDLALIACAGVFSLHIMCIDRFCDVDGVLLSCLQFLVAGAMSMLAALVTEPVSLQAAARGWFPVVYAGIFSCGIAYTFQIIGQKGVDPAIASLILSLESVVSVLAGFLLLGQELSARELLGCVLMFAAIILVQLPGPSEREARSEGT
ncbi:MAG: DMT family transporter [Eubacteriales bacterium]|nr:DMT family transporter [Eubacteriales bacterium]